MTYIQRPNLPFHYPNIMLYIQKEKVLRSESCLTLTLKLKIVLEISCGLGPRRIKRVQIIFYFWDHVQQNG